MPTKRDIVIGAKPKLMEDLIVIANEHGVIHSNIYCLKTNGAHLLVDEEIFMYQSNLIIVKSNDAVSYLQKMKYNVVPMELSGGWRACCSFEKCYFDQVIGSKASTLAQYGKYPYELSATDYTRAIQKENDFLDLVLSRQKEDDFAERKKQECAMSSRRCQLAMEIGLWDPQKNSAEEENELREKKEEMLMLEDLLKEIWKDKVLM